MLFYFHPKSNLVMWCKSSNGFENSIFHFSGVHWTEYWKHQTVWSALCLVGCRPSPPPLSLSFKHKERNIKKEPPYWVHDGYFFMKQSEWALNNHALLNSIWKELKTESTNKKTIFEGHFILYCIDIWVFLNNWVFHSKPIFDLV